MSQTKTKLRKVQTQQEIVQGVLQNDERILKLLYANVYPKVRSLVLKNSGNEAQSKDIFQDAFIACWKNIKAGKLAEKGNVEAYLYTIAKNKWTDYLRSSDYKKRVSNIGISITTRAEDNIDLEESQDETNRAAMKQALNQLGHNCKRLLNLYYYERKSMNEISEVMNLASASARNQKYRCMEKLRTLSLEIKNNG